jgi:hypothetical protein
MAMQLKNLKRREFIRLGGISIAGSVLIPSLIRKKKGSTIKYVNLHFDSSISDNALTNYFEILVYNYASSVGGYSGWHLFTGSTGAFEWKTYGSPDWANIKYIRILAESDGTINSDVTIGPIYAFIPPNAKALVSIGMDGAYSGHLKAVNYANSKGIPITLYVSAPLIGGVGRLTLTQLQDIKRWTRNLVASYIYPFQKNWQDMDLATQINEVKANASWLQANGFGDGAKICSPAGVGVRSEDIQRLIMKSFN